MNTRYEIKNSIYNEIGVEPVLNASGTKTTHGGTQISKKVQTAMAAASFNFVSVEELNIKVGEYIAKVTESEAGMVTSGAASGVVLSTAACMTGTNEALVRQLPNTKGLKNEVIIQKIHMGSYAHMHSFTGAKIVEIGHMGGCSVSELINSINENTAAISFLCGPRILRNGLCLSEIVEIAKKYSLPVIVDAAAMLPPKSNLSKYIRAGADLVTISGGKFLKGPQNSGLLFGKKNLIQAAMANCSPKHSIGRPHKVSKETIVGLYTALKEYMELDEENTLRNYNNMLTQYLPLFESNSLISAHIVHDEINYNVPVIAISSKSNEINLKEVPEKMLSNPPRVFLQYFAELDHLVINPISLTEIEMAIVTNKLKFILEQYVK